ncbi:MAG TPA: NAD(P)H-dependent oxidoreductase [Fulvivirga sp.]|nr:NAD(P)H-dependent oxidoreductase [Fulvivirga sp.]
MGFTTSILYGSVRSNRKGIRAVKFLEKQLVGRGHKVHILDPLEIPLPFLDKMYKEFPEGEAPANMQKIADTLNDSDGYIIVTGEYNHSIPPALKNMLDHFQKEYFFKPSGIACYSAGQYGGMRAAVHVRAIMPELGSITIPVILGLPKISKIIDENGNAIDEYYIKATSRFLSELEWYQEALKVQRGKGLPY